MSGKNALAKLRAKSRAGLKPKSKAGLVDVLEDMIVDDMIGAMSKIGEMADEVDDWRTTKVQVVKGYDGVVADVRLPRVPVVEMDGMILFDLMYKSASDVSGAVVQFYTNRMLGPFTESHDYKVWRSGVDTGNPAMDVVIRTMEILMEGQGWRLARGSWRSPAWLFPPMSIPREAIQAHVESEFDAKLLLRKVVNRDYDQIETIAEGL